MDISLKNMALFVDVVKAGGFRRASTITGVPNSTLSRRISELEKSIGLRLLYRTTRKIELTEAGRIYYDRCKRIVEEARLAHEQLGDMLEDPGGLLRISLPTDFSITYLTPIITEFANKYPKIQFDLDLSYREVDLIREGFDLVISVGSPSDDLLIARKLTDIKPYLYATKEYLDKWGVPEKPADLEFHYCISMLGINNWVLFNNGQEAKVSLHSRYAVNSIGMASRLASRHQGIALISRRIIEQEFNSEMFERVLPDWHGAELPVFALTETRLLPAKTQFFIRFLKERLNADNTEY